jgi:hypothetical protein
LQNARALRIGHRGFNVEATAYHSLIKAKKRKVLHIFSFLIFWYFFSTERILLYKRQKKVTKFVDINFAISIT